MKNKLKIIIPTVLGTALGLYIVNILNSAIREVNDKGLTLVIPNQQQDTLWQNILFGGITFVTVIGCVVIGWFMGRKYEERL